MIEIYIGSSRLDTYKDEDINITLNIQNIKDISKLFVDFTQNFSAPASAANNAAFKHYYNADVSGGFTASQRQAATILIDKEPFREGTIELLGVNLEQGKAVSYELVFFSAGVNLKDLFGEDELTGLDFSAYDHEYLASNIRAGLEGKSLFSGNIIYPLISPVVDWFYDSASSSHTAGDLAYHTTNDDHGLNYYELKPAVKLAAIIDAIEAKYGITFTSTFFGTSKFTDLYMWCHRREGYMFFGQENGFTAKKINFTSATGSGFDITDDVLVVPSTYDRFLWRYSITSTSDYQVHFYINGVYYTSRSHSGNVTDEDVYFGGLSTGDRVQMRFSPPTNWDGGSVALTSVSASGRVFDNPVLTYWTASTTSTQSFQTDVIVSDQMPEQKVYDFITGLVKMFNLVIEPTSRTSFIVEPLDDWYALGTNYDITQYADTTSTSVTKPELYKRISFDYQQSDAYLMRAYRLANGGIAYGDLRADFTFDGPELKTQTTFELLKYTKLDDPSNGYTNWVCGKSIDKDGDPYIGEPVIFYSSNTINISAYPIGYLDETGLTPSPDDPVETINLVCNVNARTANAVTQMLTYGLEVDPYHEQSFAQTLYNQFWEDYITDLYATSRRVYQLQARFPAKLLASLRMNDKLDIAGRRYVINQVKVNLNTNEATLELLNDV
jgi:hypothetical protein